jgi:hypothetical protein
MEMVLHLIFHLSMAARWKPEIKQQAANKSAKFLLDHSKHDILMLTQHVQILHPLPSLTNVLFCYVAFHR